MQFRGALTALVTPFRNGAFDEEAYRAFIDWQIEQGIDGVVPCGTTGESATLSHDEHKRVVRTCVEHVAGRVPVLAGAGSNNTKEAIELAKDARDVGADGLLLITPYYNKPTQEGLYQHFKAIAAEVQLPFIVYNVPGRTGVNLLPETLARMARDIPQVQGTKDATANLRQVSDIAEYCGPDFMLISGDDFTVLPLLSVGGCGVISVVANIAPSWMAGLCKAFSEGDMDTAREYHFKLQPLSRGCFLETNPTPVKTALSMMGKIPKEFRLPMVPLQPQNEDALKKILADAGLI
ncbi:MAG: 4-hydroxy-tetrahydrodipicolinate synthase [Oceanidesulfovibrio sp.]